MGMGSTEILIFFFIFVILLRGSRLRELMKFGGLAYAYKYPGLRVATRVPPPAVHVAWVAIAALVVLIFVIALAA